MIRFLRWMLAAGMVILCCSAAWSEDATPTSKTDAFLRFLLEKVSPDEGKPFESISARIDWDALQKEVDKGETADERTRRQEYVEMWKALAGIRDYAMGLTVGGVFENKALELLSGSRLFLGQRDFDPYDFRHYFLSEELPAWAKGLRFLAAGLIAGDGEAKGMAALVAGFRDGAGGAVGIGAWAAVTKKALPLWEPLLKDADPKVREWAAHYVAAITGKRPDEVLPKDREEPRP